MQLTIVKSAGKTLDTYNKKRRGRKLGTGSATKEKPSKWILEDALSFMDTAIYERQ